MSRRHFSWLFALTVAAVVVIGFLPERAGREAGFEPQPLLPGLRERVNDLAEIRVVGAGEQPIATLSRSGQAWTVAEAAGYPADWPRLRSLLAALAQATIVEPKTANPEYFDRLGLRDVTDAESQAIRIRLGGADDAPALLVGDTARNRDGQYVRREGEERALLIDRTLDVPGETRDWLDRQIVDVAEAEVVEVEITHPDGERVVLRKASADASDFVLQDVPEGREAQSSWTVNAPGGALAGLRLDDVQRADAVVFESPVRFRALTSDGLQLLAELAEVDERFWIALRAEARESPDPAPAGAAGDEARSADGAAESAPPGAGSQEESLAGRPDEGALAPGDTDDGKAPADRAAEINARVSGWVYAIPQYKFDTLTRRAEDLLKPLEPAD